MIAAIIQARVGSTRLPGKVLRDLAGTPVLGHVIRRVSAIPGIDAVWCAVPDLQADDALVPLAEQFGARVSRGPEHDVLERYVLAARAAGADVVMRITSDCPLLDPTVSGMVLAKLLETGTDYVSNVDPRSWPRGLDTEVMTRDALERMTKATNDAYDREHVTPWLRRSSGVRRFNVSLPDDRYAGWRWTLDYEDDLAFMQNVLAKLPAGMSFSSFDEIRSVVEANPQIAAINSHLD